MSTSATDPGAVSAGPVRNSRAAGAVLALVFAIGVVFAFSQSDGVTKSPAPAHPMVSDAHRAKAELLEERAEERAAAQEQSARSDPAWQQYEDYVRSLTERAEKTGTGEIGGD